MPCYDFALVTEFTLASRSARARRFTLILGSLRSLRRFTQKIYLRLSAFSCEATLICVYPRACAKHKVSGAPGFSGVTGGEYKAWERIHRGMADPRLLAIPAS